MTSDSERIAVAQELAQCVSAAYRALKALAPDAHPWAGNMLGTEHLQKLGTTVFLTLNRWGIDPPRAPPSVGAQAPAAPKAKEDGDAAREARKQSTASLGPARGDPVEGWTFGASRTTKGGRLQWYSGVCRTDGKPAWTFYEPDEGTDGEHQCLSCFKKEHPR